MFLFVVQTVASVAESVRSNLAARAAETIRTENREVAAATSKLAEAERKEKEGKREHKQTGEKPLLPTEDEKKVVDDARAFLEMVAKKNEEEAIKQAESYDDDITNAVNSASNQLLSPTSMHHLTSVSPFTFPSSNNDFSQIVNPALKEMENATEYEVDILKHNIHMHKEEMTLNV